ARVFELFSAERPEWGVTEVSRALRIPKSSAHALLATLCRVGLLRKTPQNRYRLGWRVLALTQVLLDSTEFRAEALPAMQRLVARFGETVHLAVLEDGQVVYVEKLEGTRAVRVAVSRVGARLPAHCSAVGKVLLAHQPWEKVEAVAALHGLPALTPNTITSLERLRAELQRVREQGFAYDHEEVMPDLCCVAAPIRDHSGAVVAAMSLSVPAYRFRQHRDEYRRAILDAARQVSENLGFFPTGGLRWDGLGMARWKLAGIAR
ncbi:MAG TPA: IclR family transcriptional regulator, partial [Limnochordales bacterium]